MKIHPSYSYPWGFPGSSAGKESVCNTGDPSSISGSGRPSGEGISYSLQCSWAFLVVWMIKNLHAMRKTWVWSLGWEDPLEKGTATHSSILAWRIPWTEGVLQATVHGVTKNQIGLNDFHFHSYPSVLQESIHPMNTHASHGSSAILWVFTYRISTYGWWEVEADARMTMMVLPHLRLVLFKVDPEKTGT